MDTFYIAITQTSADTNTEFDVLQVRDSALSASDEVCDPIRVRSSEDHQDYEAAIKAAGYKILDEVDVEWSDFTAWIVTR